MSDKPTAAWYLAPIFLGIIGSAIMWYVLKDEDHHDSPKMIKKGWVIGIVLTLIPLLMMIPMLILIPMTTMNDFNEMQDHMEVIPGPVVQMVHAPGFVDVTEMIVEDGNERMITPIIIPTFVLNNYHDDFEVTSISCMINSDFVNFDFNIINKLDNNFLLELHLLQTNINNEDLSREGILVETIAGKTTTKIYQIPLEQELNTCGIEIKRTEIIEN
jgi:hypothetical protein